MVCFNVSAWSDMFNVAAKPFRMMASGNSEKLNRELIACFVRPWK